MLRKDVPIFVGALVALTLLISAGTAQAVPITAGAYLTVERTTVGTTSGGEFLVKPYYAGSFDPFVSFCLQLSEIIHENEIYYVKAVSTFAEFEPVSRGGDGTGKDPMSSETAWIYDRYLAGDWTALGLGGVSDPDARADAVQRAMWCLEGDISCPHPFDPNANKVWNAALSAGAIGLYDVGVLNLYKAAWNPRTRVLEPTGIRIQDLAAPAIPEPASMLLFGSGLAGLAGMVRRRKK